jgi:DNA repair photolyase
VETTTQETLTSRVELLLRPLREGALPRPWRFAEYETEQGVTLRLHAPGRALVVELEAADADRPCFARTERFNVYYSVVGRPSSEPLRREELGALEAVVKVLREREGMLPASETEPVASRRMLVREVRVDRALVQEGPAAYYMNPYVGCMYACPFCYAAHRADFSRSLEGAPIAPWGRWLDVKVNLAEVLEREVATRKPGTVRMSPIITDPYQPVERRFRITRACLEVLAKARFTPVVLTRSPLVLDDLELLRSMDPGPLIGMSIPTDDDAVRAAIEPDTEPVDARFDALAKLREAGLRTFAILQPMLPLDPDRMAARLAPVVEAVRIGPLYEKPRIAQRLTVLGREDILEESWERATFEALRERLEARGVIVNGREEPWSLLT